MADVVHVEGAVKDSGKAGKEAPVKPSHPGPGKVPQFRFRYFNNSVARAYLMAGGYAWHSRDHTQFGIKLLGRQLCSN